MMTPEQELALNRACDAMLEVCTSEMAEDGAEPERIIDRVLTFGCAHIVTWHGRVRAAEILRTLADNVEAGVFRRIDPTEPGRHQ